MTPSSVGPDQNPDDGTARPKRRRFSDAYKLRIVEEADRCNPGEIGLLLRREGLYSSHLATWRRWRRHAVPDHPESRKPATEGQLRHEIARLQRDNTRLQLKLDHADKLLALQKKLADMMESIPPNDANDGRSA